MSLFECMDWPTPHEALQLQPENREKTLYSLVDPLAGNNGPASSSHSAVPADGLEEHRAPALYEPPRQKLRGLGNIEVRRNVPKN
jgi:hypothetical protein